MIRTLLERRRARLARERADRDALKTYRTVIESYRRWFASEPDVCAVLENLAGLAGDDQLADLHDTHHLRDKVAGLRAARFKAAHEKALRDALMHLRLLVRDIDGVGETWADERRRCTLSGGTVTLGELRAAKRFISRIDSERIAAHEGPHKTKTTGAQA